MGYHTDFEGSFKLDKPLTLHQKNYLEKFSDTRKVTRDVEKTKKLADPLRDFVNLDIGPGALYFVNPTNDEWSDPTVIDPNYSPFKELELYCDWTPNEDGTEIINNGSEKSYTYVEWLEFIIAHFLVRWGLTLNGTVKFQGEEAEDMGKIVVKDNKVEVIRPRIVWDEIV